MKNTDLQASRAHGEATEMFDAVRMAGWQVVGISRPEGEEIHAHASEVDISSMVSASDFVIQNDKAISDLEFAAYRLGCNTLTAGARHHHKPKP